MTKKGIDKHCLGCRMYAKIYDDLCYCSYLFVKDHRRPCPPGKDCTVKEMRRKRKAVPA